MFTYTTQSIPFVHATYDNRYFFINKSQILNVNTRELEKDLLATVEIHFINGANPIRLEFDTIDEANDFAASLFDIGTDIDDTD